MLDLKTRLFLTEKCSLFSYLFLFGKGGSAIGINKYLVRYFEREENFLCFRLTVLSVWDAGGKGHQYKCENLTDKPEVHP